MSNFTCDKGCCHYKVTKYIKPFIKKKFKDEFEKNDKKINKKAGIFLFDPTCRKVLLVQSRGKLWGPPKGSLEEGEDNDTCARRELREETGIDILNIPLSRGMYIKNNAFYYYLEAPEQEINIQNHLGNDANGIGWFSLDCINELILKNRIMINQHCKLGFKKYFDL